MLERIALCVVVAAACQKAPGPGDSTNTNGKGGPGAGGDDNVTIKTIPVAGQVTMLEGKGGNIGVFAGPDGVVLIDDQFAPLVPKIKAAVEALGHGAPDYVINTHWHGDHTGGNVQLGKSAVIMAHDNVRKRLATGWKRGDQTIEPIEKSGWPVVTFRDSIQVHLNGEYLDIVHFGRGHTDGDSVVFFSGSNAVHMGDLYFNGRFPFIDLSSGGDVEAYLAAVEKVLSRVEDDTKIIPGHGPLSGKTELLEFRAMLVDTIGHVKKAKAAGKSLEQIQSAGLSKKYDDWKNGFVDDKKWIETIYNSAGE